MSIIQLVIMVVCILSMIFAAFKRIFWAVALIALVMVLNYFGVIEFMFTFVDQTLIRRPSGSNIIMEYIRDQLV